ARRRRRLRADRTRPQRQRVRRALPRLVRTASERDRARRGGRRLREPAAARARVMELTVSAPASSANLGAGFDAVALALELRMTARVRELPPGTSSEWT